MAEDQDDSQKTEEPTPRKLEEAAKRGEFAHSIEFKHWLLLFGGAVAWLVVGAPIARSLLITGRGFLDHAGELPVDAALPRLLVEALGSVFWPVMGFLGLVLLAGIGSNLLQHRPVFTFEKMKPSPDKISPLKGAKRLFSAERAAEFLKSLLKLLAIGGIVVLVLWPEVHAIEGAVNLPLVGMLGLIERLAIKVVTAVVASMAVIALADYLFQRYRFLQRMRMSREELKDEFKQMEGDPQVKARIRQLRQERARQRMMAKVPDADVVITNPTHYAVALEYKHGRMEVPVVVAKGVDAVALRIRALAEEHGIPIVENPPLARSLYDSVDLDAEIRPEHYQAVAEVIGFVMRLARQRSWRQSGRQRPSAGRRAMD